MATVTVVIAVRDTPARMLQECWQSILQQTYSDWHAIFVDDGSTLEETKTVLAEIAKHPKATVLRQEASGLAAALNAGLQAAQTDLVARIDSDDIMCPERLAVQVDYMQRHPEVDILGAQIEAFEDTTGKTKWQTHHPEVVSWPDVRRRLMKEHPWFLNHPAVIFRKNRILAIGGYDAGLVYCEDLDLWLKALHAGYQIRNLPQVLVKYRLHSGQITRHKELSPIVSKMVEGWRKRLRGELPDRIFLIGYPGDVGGAGTECWHTLLLWRKYNLQVTCIPTWGPPMPCWRQRVNLLGYPTIETKPENLKDVPGLEGATIVSFCNSQFLANADRFRDLGCRIIWAGCMCWLFDAEKKHYARRGPFDAYVFQSQYQMDTLRPQLARFGVRPEQMHLVRAAFITEEWPFQPRPHKKGEPLVVGRISRPAADKFHPKTWWIYERIPHPIQARIMAWGPEVEKKIGPPPPWAEVMPSRTETAQEFLGKLHVMLQVNGTAQENWPRSGLEAMARGVAIVAPNRWGWREMIRHGVTGFLADTEEEMAYYAARLAYDEGLRQFMVRAARNHLETTLAKPDTIWANWQRVFAAIN